MEGRERLETRCPANKKRAIFPDNLEGRLVHTGRQSVKRRRRHIFQMLGKYACGSLVFPCLISKGGANFPFAQVSAVALLTDTQAFDQLAVLGDIFISEILQQPLSFSYEHQQRAPAGVVFPVLLEVLRQFLDAEGKQGNLAFCRASVCS